MSHLHGRCTVKSVKRISDLDIAALQEVRWVEAGTQPADYYIYFTIEMGAGFFVHKGIIPAVKRLELISGRMSYITLRGRWCDTVVVNVHTPTEDESDDTKGSFTRNQSVYWTTFRSTT